MATFFRNKVIKSVGTVPVEIVTVATGSKVTAIGLSIATYLMVILVLVLQLKMIQVLQDFMSRMS